MDGEPAGVTSCIWCSVGETDEAVSILRRYMLLEDEDRLHKLEKDLSGCWECVKTYHAARHHLLNLEDNEHQEIGLFPKECARMQRCLNTGDQLGHVNADSLELSIFMKEVLQFPYYLYQKEFHDEFIQAVCLFLDTTGPKIPSELFPGFYLLVIHPNKKIHKWAQRTICTFPSITLDEYGKFVSVINLVLSVLDWDLLTNPDLGDSLGSGTPSTQPVIPSHLFTQSSFWSGLSYLLRKLDPFFMKEIAVPSSQIPQTIFNCVKEHKDNAGNKQESGEQFWSKVLCLKHLLQTLESSIWSMMNNSPENVFLQIISSVHSQELVEILGRSSSASSEPLEWIEWWVRSLPGSNKNKTRLIRFAYLYLKHILSLIQHLHHHKHDRQWECQRKDCMFQIKLVPSSSSTAGKGLTKNSISHHHGIIKLQRMLECIVERFCRAASRKTSVRKVLLMDETELEKNSWLRLLRYPQILLNVEKLKLDSSNKGSSNQSHVMKNSPVPCGSSSSASSKENNLAILISSDNPDDSSSSDRHSKTVTFPKKYKENLSKGEEKKNKVPEVIVIVDSDDDEQCRRERKIPKSKENRSLLLTEPDIAAKKVSGDKLHQMTEKQKESSSKEGDTYHPAKKEIGDKLHQIKEKGEQSSSEEGERSASDEGDTYFSAKKRSFSDEGDMNCAPKKEIGDELHQRKEEGERSSSEEGERSSSQEGDTYSPAKKENNRRFRDSKMRNTSSKSELSFSKVMKPREYHRHSSSGKKMGMSKRHRLRGRSAKDGDRRKCLKNSQFEKQIASSSTDIENSPIRKSHGHKSKELKSISEDNESKKLQSKVPSQ